MSPPDWIRDRVMEGETPLQVLARQGRPEPTRMRSIERFPYYTSFPFAWYRAAFSEDVPAGAVRTVRFLNRDLVVWRGQDGAPHVMDAYCPHLGAHLGHGGRVEGCELVCPFHWWRFDGDGCNTMVPYEGARNPAARIHTYPSVDVNGFVMFWYHPKGEPPAWEIPPISELSDPGWTDYARWRWQVRAPWQELAENGPDFIHLRTVHGSVDIPELEAYTNQGHRSSTRARVNFATPRGPQPGRIDTDGWGPGFSLARFHGIIDLCFVAASTPIDFEITEVTHSYKVRKLGDDPKSLAATQRVGDAFVRELVRQEEEDIVIFDSKIYQPAPRLSRADGPIVEFRKWASQFYVEGDPRAVNR